MWFLALITATQAGKLGNTAAAPKPVSQIPLRLAEQMAAEVLALAAHSSPSIKKYTSLKTHFLTRLRSQSVLN